MLTPFDDYPIHNGSMPIVHPSSGDPNHYDRYFFAGHNLDATMYIGGAMGHYPVRAVIDGAFAVAVDGVQHSVFASGMMPFDRTTEVGPLRIEVVEPLRTIRYIVEPNDTGITADVTFRARTAAVEEPRQQTWTEDGVSLMDYTRLTQWGTWEGEVAVAGQRHVLDPAVMRGTRDRSWGTRPMAGPAATNRKPWMKQHFWLWAPLHFDDICTHLALLETADGVATVQAASLVPLLDGPVAPTHGLDPCERLDAFEREVEWEPGTRQMRRATLTLNHSDGTSERIEFESCFHFRMRGLGYGHPDWAHGSALGELKVGGESIPLGDFDPLRWENIHVQTVCKVRRGNKTGIGVLEQFVVGPHHPTGLGPGLSGYDPAAVPDS